MNIREAILLAVLSIVVGCGGQTDHEATDASVDGSADDAGRGEGSVSSDTAVFDESAATEAGATDAHDRGDGACARPGGACSIASDCCPPSPQFTCVWCQGSICIPCHPQ